MENQSLTRRMGAFSLATLISRILGYVRDALVATTFGGGLVTDAFYAAFKIPNLLRRFLGEGSLTAAFIPVLTTVQESKGKKEATQFFQALFSGLLLVSMGIVLVGFVFAPQITDVIAWGFRRDLDKYNLTVDLVRLTFPFLIVVSAAALVSAVLNSSGRFFITGVAPSGLSVAEIAFIVVLASRMNSPIHGLAISAVVGGLLHFVGQLPSLYKEGFHLKLVSPFRNPEVKRVIFLMIPTILGLCADQVNSFVDQICASFLQDGSVTALYNSSRVMQLPLALFGVAVSSVALPALSRSAHRGETQEFKNLVNFSIRVSNYVLIPSLIGLVVLGFPITQALFQHGRFTYENSQLTYGALAPYCLGLPAYSTVKILASSFYAYKDTRTPVKIAVISMVMNAILNVVLMQFLQVAGLALATAISAWFQAIALFYLLRKKLGLIGGRDILKSFLFGTLAGLTMGAVIGFLSHILMDRMSLPFNVILSVATGVLFYGLLSKAMNIKEYRYFLDGLFKHRLEK